MAKQRRHSKKADRISSLQDELLCLIISFLSIKEAFRTSILSRRWRNVFPSMPNLDFEDCFTLRKSDSILATNFIDRVLLFRHAGLVDRFRLKCGNFIKPEKVDAWVRCVLKKKVKDLDLWLGCRDQTKLYMTLPVRVFTCSSLVSLKLDVYNEFFLKLPVEVRLPCLKVLHLSGIKYNDNNNDGHDSIQRLVSSCPVLEELLVTRCVMRCRFSVCKPNLKRLTIANTWNLHDDYGVVIEAPSLVYFKCFYLPGHFMLKNLNSLVEADIEFGSFFNFSRSFLTRYEAGKNLLRWISNVQRLRLSGSFGKPIVEYHSLIPEFPQLTCLNLDANFSVGWETVLPLLLARFPRIEALVLKIKHCWVKLPSAEIPFLSLTRLKTLRISSFQQNELRMLKQFLKNAEALENLTLEITAKNWKDSEQRRSKISRKLLNLPKASNKCSVSVNFT